MTIHIALCCHMPDHSTSEMLRSLAKCSSLESVETLWLVENGTTASSYQPPPESHVLPIKHVVLPESGVARARQWVVSQLQRGLVVFLDDDLEVHHLCIEAYAHAAARYGAGFIYGGPLGVSYESRPPEWLIPHLPRSARGWDPTNPEDDLAKNPWFMGANFAAYSEDILASGGFNVALGPGAGTSASSVYPSGHEVDLQSRMIANGIALKYVPQARVVHRVPSNQCTPGWSLERIYKNGIHRGMKSKLTYPRLPRYYIREFLEALASYAASTLVQDEEQRYVMRKRWSAIKGFLKGRRLERKLQSKSS